MSQDTEDKTEDPSEKRRQETKDKGQVVRSKEFNTVAILFIAAFGCVGYGSEWVQAFKNLFKKNFSAASYLNNEKEVFYHFGFTSMIESISPLLPFFLMVLVGALCVPFLIGGLSFSWGTIAPKFEKLNPMEGLKKVISIKSVIELGKSILKLLVLVFASLIVVKVYYLEIMSLDVLHVEPAVSASFDIIEYSFFFLCSALLIVVGFDIPLQFWQFWTQMKMTKQEVRDEYKETEGSPEVKGKIRRMQREMAQKRMMAKVPEADVIITNPTHYAIALKYEQGRMSAPVVIAKGLDQIAQKIKQVGGEHGITLIEAPRLARALYYSTNLDREVPAGLYVAVAQILAYVYELKLYQKGFVAKPLEPKNYPIPEELER